MGPPRRLLRSAAAPPEPVAADSDVVVVLASLLCGLICAVGLALVARCAWLRRAGGAGAAVRQKKGVKKKVLRALPRLTYRAAESPLAECAICLAEFEDGDEVRLLPQCAHAFHVSCVDVWLSSHSTCPSCRRVLAPPPPRCDQCEASCSKTAHDGDGPPFLP
ncbi:putative E3 ubiquitin-protein ligase ATL44 [Wolffia australiana]